MNQKTEFLTTKQVSEYLSIPLRTTQYLSKQGKIKSFKVGNQWRYFKEDIENYGLKFTLGEKDNFLTAKQISKYLFIHLRTIHRLSKQGKVRAFKIGGRWRYLKSDIEKYSLNNTDFSKEPTRIPSNFIEHRSFPRINCSITCHITIIIPEKKEVHADARILNISEGGLFLENIKNEGEFLNIRMDDPMNLSFEMNGKDNLEVGGRVLRIQNGGVAIKFRSILGDARDKINHYIG